MKFSLLLISIFFVSCQFSKTIETKHKPLPIEGTWKLLSGTIIENDDTTVTSYTDNVSFIKIINDSHFAFLKHPLAGNKDSTIAFDAGGGSYTLQDSIYTERLEYHKAKEWENNDFKFTIFTFLKYPSFIYHYFFSIFTCNPHITHCDSH